MFFNCNIFFCNENSLSLLDSNKPSRRNVDLHKSEIMPAGSKIDRVGGAFVSEARLAVLCEDEFGAARFHKYSNRLAIRRRTYKYQTASGKAAGSYVLKRSTNNRDHHLRVLRPYDKDNTVKIVAR